MTNVLKKMIHNGVEYEIPSGASITVDSALSDSSENPVQNKVVKGALDAKITTPSGGTVGQVLTKTNNGVEWCDAGGGGGVIAYGNVGYLIVGGGGSTKGPGNSSQKANPGAGGGGGGGVIECSSRNILLGKYKVVVGAGGAVVFDWSDCRGCNGGNSCFIDKIAYGGGGGGKPSINNRNGASGGSGGGGSCCYVSCGAGAGGSGVSGQGYAGGCGANSYGAGGGGGAGGAGGNASGSCGGNGGVGKASSMTGVSRCYGGGGGGWGFEYYDVSCCLHGVNNGLGQCGGGGGGRNATFAGNPGIVVVRYKKDGSDGIDPNTSSGGCKYNCGNYTIHCFTDTSSVQYLTLCPTS